MSKRIKIFWIGICLVAIGVSTAWAQYTAQKEAVYMATLKAVTDYKMGDEENIDSIEKLRENARFNKQLREMMSKLSNRRTKNSTNTKIYKILLQAGKEIYNELN